MSAKSPPAADSAVTLDINLLGRDYQVACAPSERAELQAAVAVLDARRRVIRDQGKIAGAERVAVMAALNLANELLHAKRASGADATRQPAGIVANAIDDAVARRRITSMHSTIDQALAGFENLS